mmetsp:Transcript_8402/g.15795  ORF Transcript_8402/g.15795 Transcript_8402/m.15795 type:complete len:314 (+) Transcript_8402:336-1277(+)
MENLEAVDHGDWIFVNSQTGDGVDLSLLTLGRPLTSVVCDGGDFKTLQKIDNEGFYHEEKQQYYSLSAVSSTTDLFHSISTLCVIEEYQKSTFRKKLLNKGVKLAGEFIFDSAVIGLRAGNLRTHICKHFRLKYDSLSRKSQKLFDQEIRARFYPHSRKSKTRTVLMESSRRVLLASRTSQLVTEYQLSEESAQESVYKSWGRPIVDGLTYVEFLACVNTIQNGMYVANFCYDSNGAIKSVITDENCIYDDVLLDACASYFAKEIIALVTSKAEGFRIDHYKPLNGPDNPETWFLLIVQDTNSVTHFVPLLSE